MLSRLAGIVALIVPIVAFAQTDVIDVPMDASWTAHPGWTGTETAAEHSAEPTDQGLSLRASGDGGVMVWARYPDTPTDVSKMGFVTMRYRAEGIDPGLVSYLLYLAGPEDTGMLAHNLAMAASDLVIDGQWHTATTTLHSYGKVKTFALRFGALQGKVGKLDVAYLRFTPAPPLNKLSELVPWEAGQGGVVTEPVDLSALRQSSVADVQKALDLSDWFTQSEVTVSGVRFTVPTEGPAAISTGVEEKPAIEIPVHRSGRALCLLMGAKFPYKMLGYSGWVPGDMTDRPEQFMLSVHYADGAVTEHVPYCVNQAKHGVWRGLNVYAVPLEPGRPVQTLVAKDGMRTSSFHLVAASIAQDDVVPSPSSAACKTPAGAPPLAIEPSLELQGNRLLVRTQAGEMVLDLAGGIPSLSAVRNGCNPDCGLQAKPVPLLSIAQGRNVYAPETFRLAETPAVSRQTAQLKLSSDEARVAAMLSLAVRDRELSMGLTVENTAAEARTLDITFPQVRLDTARPRDAWYFYPRMCPVWSSAEGTYEEPYGGQFPVQFLDMYDRQSGGGLSIGTRGREFQQRYYRLTKQGGVLSAHVQYRNHPTTGPGACFSCPESVLALHGGDFHPALDAYLSWFRSWYRPARPRLDWYRKIWNFRTYWTHTMGDGDPESNLFDRAQGDFRTRHFIDKDRELYGQVDMAHLFDWRVSEKYGRYGDFSHFDDIGGLDKFRAMVKGFQDQGIRLGLYLDCYLCSRKSLVGQAHGDEWAIRRPDGSIPDTYTSPEDPMLNMCVLHPGWQNHLAQACANAVKLTGCDGVYLDEGTTDLEGYWCYSPDHGHPVPGVNQAGLMELVKKVRAAVPEGTAVYTEWSPADVFIPYLDGAYQASMHLSDIRVSPGFLQLARFTFPDFRVFTISNAGSMYDGIWEGLKYNLFSGVPLYTLSWGHDEEAYPLVRKISQILHEHQEGFLTTDPRPFIPTERSEVYCNQFPGAQETVWTLLNGRYDTVAGPVLRVRHVPGARYLDLWNGGKLTPRLESEDAVLEVTLGPRGVGVVAQVKSER